MSNQEPAPSTATENSQGRETPVPGATRSEPRKGDTRPAPIAPVTPAAWTQSASSYSPPAPSAPITLKLDANEGATPAPWLRDTLSSLDLESLRLYPRPRDFESFLAARLDLDPARVLVTAGGDDAIDRACRVMLGAGAPVGGRELLLPVPTFEMFARYAAINNAPVAAVPWPDQAYPTAEVLARITGRTAMIAVVSPNNPTGAVIDAPSLSRISVAARRAGALVLADLAYAEFADEDLTGLALSLPNVVVVRTMSKAWGLAGLRVGYALGPPDVIAWMRAAGGPYAVSGVSLAIARACMERAHDAMAAAVARARREREELRSLLASRGIPSAPSQGNFVFARFADADSIRASLARRGIAVRGFPGDPRLSDALRITVPCDESAFAQLAGALREVLAPVADRGESP